MKEPHDPRELFQRLLVGGRWLLLAAELVAALFLLPSTLLGPISGPVLALFFIYSAASLVAVRQAVIQRSSVRGLLALDLLWITFAAYHTGGSGSPFLGLAYLVILAGALFYNLPGGLTLGIASALLAVGLARFSPSGNWADLWPDLRNLAFYYVLVGGFTGYLAGTLKAWFLRYQRSQSEIQEREVQEVLRRREMELARNIQQAALPTTPPRIPGLDIAVRLEFAREVGGDFCLFLPDGERIALVVGDVSGKGTPAALVSTTIAYLLPALWPSLGPPEAICTLNRALRERLPAAAFVTMVVAEVDLEAETMRLWNAGHPAPLLWRAPEARVMEAEVFNPVLGVLPGCECHPKSWPFQIGDLLLLYSDGLTEAQNADGEQFTDERVRAVLAQHAHGSAAEVAEALAAAVRNWGSLSDDLTLVVCKRVPDPAPAGSASVDNEAPR